MIALAVVIDVLRVWYLFCATLCFRSHLMRMHKKQGDWPVARELVILQVG